MLLVGTEFKLRLNLVLAAGLFSLMSGLPAAGKASERVHVEPKHRFETTGSRIMSFSFSRDGAALATGGWIEPKERGLEGFKRVEDGTAPGDIRIWDVATGSERCRIALDLGPVAAVALTADGKALFAAGRVYGSKDQSVVVAWNAETQQMSKAFSGHKARVSLMDCSPDGKLLAAFDDTKNVVVWSVASGEVLTNLSQASHLSTLRFSADGQLLFSCSHGGTVAAWDIATWAERLRFESKGLRLCQIDLSSDGKLVGIGGVRAETDQIAVQNLLRDKSEGILSIWDITAATEQTSISLNGYTGGIAFSPDSKHLVAAGARSISVWEIGTGKNKSFIERKAGISGATIRFTPDGKRLAIRDARSVQLLELGIAESEEK